MLAYTTRRGVLAAGVTALLAGCTGSEETVVDQNVSLERGEYRSFGVELNDDAELSLEATVRDGPSIDFIVMEESEYSHYEDGERFRYSSEGSLMDTTGGNASVDAPAGSYRFVIDHTNAGIADPSMTDGDVTAEVTLVADG